MAYIRAKDKTNADRQKQAYNISGNPQHLYTLCDMQVRQKAFAAKQCLSKLDKVVPETVVNQLKVQLKGR